MRSVSKAGVAQETWKQPTEGEPPVNRIAGSISGTQNSHGSIFNWSGSASFVRAAPGGGGADGYFTLQSSQYTVIASGRDGSGATARRQSGTGTVTGGSGELQVSGAMAPFDTRGGRVSVDGKAFAGSVTETSGQFSVTWNWEMTGSP